MRDQHMNPAEAVQVFADLRRRRARIGHHWGTFQLTNEAIDEPPQALAAALAQNGHAPERFQTFRPGQVFEVPA